MSKFVKSDLEAVIAEEIAPELQLVLRELSGFTARVLDKSNYAVPGIDTIHFPYRAPRTAQSTTVDGSLLAVAGKREKDTLDLSVVLGDAFTISRHLAAQAKANIAEEEMNEIVEAIKLAQSEQVYNNLAAAAYHTVTRTSSILNDIVSVRTKLRSNKVPFAGEAVTLALNTSDMAKVFASPEFARVDSFGAAGEQLKKEGIIGKIYGMYVMEHDYEESIAFHKAAAAFAQQGELLIMTEVDALGMGDTFSISVRTNSKALRSSGENKSPYIVKLVDPTPGGEEGEGEGEGEG